MRDKRAVDELSIEELERVLAIRRREDRQKRLGRMKAEGRVVSAQPDEFPPPKVIPPRVPPPDTTAIPAATITLDALDAILERKEAPIPSSEILVAAPPPAPLARPEPIVIDDEDYIESEQPQENRVSKVWMNRLLLLVEVAAVLGLVFIGANLYLAVGDLQRESAEAQALADQQRRAGIPTPAPTSVIELVKLEDYVLPGGHTINDDGIAIPNLDEILTAVPGHLQSDFIITQAFSINIRRPPATAETAIQVFIPKLNLDETIVQGTDWEALKLGVGQVQNGANPSDADGNVALAAHNDIYGALFANIDQLAPGDTIQIQTQNSIFTYHVVKTEIVNPTDVHVLENRGVATVTLISCYPPGVNDKRYIVYADREDTF